MAEMKFSVLAVVPSLQDQSIFIKCSMDIEESSVDNNNIYVLIIKRNISHQLMSLLTEILSNYNLENGLSLEMNT